MIERRDFLAATLLAPLLAAFKEQLKASPPVPGEWHRYTVVRDGNSVTMYYDGAKISHYALWNTVLTNEEVRQLSVGMSPMHVRRDGLVEYLPLTSDHRR